MSLESIDSDYIVSPKILYLFMSLSFYAFHLFRGNFILKVVGIGESLYSFMMGIFNFIIFFTTLFIANLYDKYNKPKLLFTVVLIAVLFVFQLMFFSKENFVSFSFFFLLYLIFNSCTQPMLDRYTLSFLKNNNINMSYYGRQRMYGTLAYPITTFAVEKIAKIDEYKYLPLYHAAITGICIIFAIALIRNINIVNTSNAVLNFSIFKNRNFNIFIFIILLNGITRATMTNFLNSYIVHELAIDKMDGFFAQYISTCCTITGIIFELLIFYNISSITDRFGLYMPLLFAQIFQSIRLLCYMFTRNVSEEYRVFYVLAVETFKGLNFGLTHGSAVQITQLLSPSDMKATAQAVYTGTFVPLGSMLSGIIFYVYFRYSKNYEQMFGLNLFINTLAIIIFSLWYTNMRTNRPGITKE